MCLSGVCYDNGFKAAGTACGDPSSGQCDDADTCDGAGMCLANHVADGTNCGDAGTECVNQDTCIVGACQDHGFKLAGTACGNSGVSECDSADSCDGAGACLLNYAAAGSTPCGDAEGPCTYQDYCNANGQCQDYGYKPVSTACGDPTDDQCNNPDHCSGLDGSCVNEVEPDTTTCGDAESECTYQDYCDGAGSCWDNGFQIEGTPCGDPSSGECDAADTCNGAGNCQSNHVADGANCGDAETQCTNQDTCLTGACTDHGFKSSSTPCSDGDACTQTDRCSGASDACIGSNPVVCVSSDQCHVAGMCDTGTGACSNPAKADGTFCSDSNACTQTDSCQSGVCTGSNPLVCVASDQCHVVGVCDSGTGACSNPAKPNGTSCNDGNTCTANDTCLGGACAEWEYPWTGFFQPVDNIPANNKVKAGSAIPIKFSLGCNQGLSIMAPGYPRSASYACSTIAPTDVVEETVTAGGSSLTYDASANQYIYVWKTDKAWASQCRVLEVKLADGTSHYAYFTFAK